VAFDGAHRYRQPVGDLSTGQAVSHKHDNLALAIGQWQWLDSGAKRRRAGAAALLTESLRSYRAPQRRTPQPLTAKCDGCVRGRIHRRDEVAHIFEIL
jgi:hypothetical protein